MNLGWDFGLEPNTYIYIYSPEKQKGKAVEKVVMGGSYVTMVRKPLTGNSNVVAVKVKKEESEGLIKKLKNCVVASWKDGSGGGR